MQSAIKDFFPIEIQCRETKQGVTSTEVWSPKEFRIVVQRRVPKALRWSGSSVIINSLTSVDIIVYGMKNPLFGGLGKEVYRFSSRVSEDATSHYIECKALDIAAQQREDELRIAEQKIIETYADAILRDLILEDMKTA